MLDNCYIGVYTLYMRCEKQNKNMEGKMNYMDEIWEAAEFVTEWDGTDGLRYKLYNVPRDAVDENSDEINALMVLGIDDGNVRRVDQLLDTAYGRWDSDMTDTLIELFADPETPEEAKKYIEWYILDYVPAKATNAIRDGLR